MEAAVPLDGGRKKWYVLAALALGMFMALLDATIVNIAVPAIITDLGTSITQVSWVLNAYNITLVVLFLSMGRIADRYGKKRVFIAGLVIFTLFSLACGFAPNIQFLIAFRVGQAVGAAGMVPVSLAIMLGVFPRSQHGMAVGIWGAVGSIAAALGPGLGGLLVTYGSWHWIFFVNVPIGIAALVAAVILVPESRGGERAGSGVDVPGIALSAVGIFSLTLALVQGNQWGWTSARILGLVALWAVTVALFVVWELRTSSPMLDLRLFRIRPFTAANASMLLVGTAMGGAIFLLVIFMVTVMGYSELRAALSITPLPLTALVLAPFVGRRVDKVGPRGAAAAGGLFFTAGLVALAFLDASATTGDVIWRVMLIGAGIAFSMPTLDVGRYDLVARPRARSGIGRAQHLPADGLRARRRGSGRDLLAHHRGRRDDRGRGSRGLCAVSDSDTRDRQASDRRRDREDRRRQGQPGGRRGRFGGRFSGGHSGSSARVATGADDEVAREYDRPDIQDEPGSCLLLALHRGGGRGVAVCRARVVYRATPGRATGARDLGRSLVARARPPVPGTAAFRAVLGARPTPCRSAAPASR